MAQKTPITGLTVLNSSKWEYNFYTSKQHFNWKLQDFFQAKSVILMSIFKKKNYWLRLINLKEANGCSFLRLSLVSNKKQNPGKYSNYQFNFFVDEWLLKKEKIRWFNLTKGLAIHGTSVDSPRNFSLKHYQRQLKRVPGLNGLNLPTGNQVHGNLRLNHRGQNFSQAFFKNMLSTNMQNYRSWIRKFFLLKGRADILSPINEILFYQSDERLKISQMFIKRKVANNESMYRYTPWRRLSTWSNIRNFYS